MVANWATTISDSSPASNSKMSLRSYVQMLGKTKGAVDVNSTCDCLLIQSTYITFRIAKCTAVSC